jgi:hypothetical protein
VHIYGVGCRKQSPVENIALRLGKCKVPSWSIRKGVKKRQMSSHIFMFVTLLSLISVSLCIFHGSDKTTSHALQFLAGKWNYMTREPSLPSDPLSSFLFCFHFPLCLFILFSSSLKFQSHFLPHSPCNKGSFSPLFCLHVIHLIAILLQIIVYYALTNGFRFFESVMDLLTGQSHFVEIFLCM